MTFSSKFVFILEKYDFFLKYLNFILKICICKVILFQFGGCFCFCHCKQTHHIYPIFVMILLY